MSSSLLKRAADGLKSKTAAIKRLHATHEADLAYAGGAQLLGAGGAALLDIKLGENGQQAKIGPVPTNLVGVLPAIAGVAIKGLGRFRGPLIGAGMSMASCGLYRFILDKHAEHVANNPPAP